MRGSNLFLKKFDAMRGHRTRRVEEHVNLKPCHTTFNQVAIRRRGFNIGQCMRLMPALVCSFVRAANRRSLLNKILGICYKVAWACLA